MDGSLEREEEGSSSKALQPELAKSAKKPAINISKTSKYYVVLPVLAEYYFIAGLLSESPIHNRYN